MSKKPFVFVTLLIIIALFLAACGGAAEQAQQAVEEAQQQVEEAADQAQDAAQDAAEEVQQAAEEVQQAAEEAVEDAQDAVEEAAPDEEEMMEADPLGEIVIAPGDPINIASALVIAGPNETLGVDS